MKKLTSVLLSVAMLLTMAVMFSGCGGKSNSSSQKAAKVEDNPEFTQHFKFAGPSGYATILGVDDDYYHELYRSFSDNQSRQKYKTLEDFYDDCEINIISGGENGKLKNGDVLTLKFKETLAPEIVKENNYDKNLYTSNEFTYVVNGLPNPEIVDDITMDDIEVTYRIDAEGTHPCINRNENYPYPITCEVSEKNKNVVNGDEVEISVGIDNDDEDYQKYTYKNSYTKLKFTAENVPEIPETLDGIDTSEFDKQLFKVKKTQNNDLNEDQVGKTYAYDDEIFFGNSSNIEKFCPKYNYDAVVGSVENSKIVTDIKDNYFVSNNQAYYALYFGQKSASIVDSQNYTYEIYGFYVCPVAVINGKLVIAAEGYSRFSDTIDDSNSFCIRACRLNTKSGIVQNFNNYKKYIEGDSNSVY